MQGVKGRIGTHLPQRNFVSNELSPSPHVKWKLKPQSACKTHGIDFVYNAFGPNAWHFKSFFTIHDHCIHPPPRKKRLNWKVWPLISWLNYITMLAWLLGVVFSADEQTQGLQGNHANTKRITYKAEGDGFQCNALCQDGWTHQEHFWNEPAHPEYLIMGLLPLQAHVCRTDGIYVAWTICTTLPSFVEWHLYIPRCYRMELPGKECVAYLKRRKRKGVEWTSLPSTERSRQLSYALILNSQILWLRVSMTPSLSFSSLHVARVSSG